MNRALLCLCLLTGALPAWAAEPYPNQPTRVIVPYPPGGGTDSIARMISKQLSDQIGKAFVVENRAGATGIVGSGIVAKAVPDGYTIMLADISFAMVPGLTRSLPYVPLKDFTPITQLIRSPQALVVIPSLNVNTLRDFIALAQANPGRFNYGSGGTGSSPHLSAALFNIAAKVNITHIPFKGAGDVITAMLGGQVQMHVTGIPALLPHINAGKMRALGVTTDGRRISLLPDVPSMSEAGIPGLDIYTWHGLAGPAALPRDVVNKLHAEAVKALASPSLQAQFAAQGAEPVGSTPEEFSRLIRSELQRWGEVVKAAGMTPE